MTFISNKEFLQFKSFKENISLWIEFDAATSILAVLLANILLCWN